MEKQDAIAQLRICCGRQLLKREQHKSFLVKHTLSHGFSHIVTRYSQDGSRAEQGRLDPAQQICCVEQPE